MSDNLLHSKQHALFLIEQIGECLLFPLQGYPDLFNRIAGSTVEDRRDKAWRWSDELHLEKKIFLSLAIKGRVTLTSWQYFAEVFPERSSVPLSRDEEDLIAAIEELGPISVPDLRRVASLPKTTFNKALKRLRQKMRVTIVEIKHETKTKHVYVYDVTARWIPPSITRGEHRCLNQRLKRPTPVLKSSSTLSPTIKNARTVSRSWS